MVINQLLLTSYKMKWKDPPRAQDQQINPCRAGNIILQLFNQKQDFAIDEQNKHVKRRTL